MTAVEWFAKQVLRSRQLGFISNEKFNELLEQAKEMEKEQSVHKLFVGFEEWHKHEYGSKYVEIDQFNEYLQTFKSE